MVVFENNAAVRLVSQPMTAPPMIRVSQPGRRPFYEFIKISVDSLDHKG